MKFKSFFRRGTSSGSSRNLSNRNGFLSTKSSDSIHKSTPDVNIGDRITDYHQNHSSDQQLQQQQHNHDHTKLGDTDNKEQLINKKDSEIIQLKEKLNCKDEYVKQLEEELCQLKKIHRDEQEATTHTIDNLKTHYEAILDGLKRDAVVFQKEKLGYVQEKALLLERATGFESQLKVVTQEINEYKIKYNKAQEDYEQVSSRHIEMKNVALKLRSLLAENESKIASLDINSVGLKQDLATQKDSINKERTEWKKFEQDMLLVVRVAEEFRTDAENKVQSLAKETSCLKEKIEELERKLDTNDCSVSREVPQLPIAHNSCTCNLSSENEEENNNYNSNNRNELPHLQLIDSVTFDSDISDKENQSCSANISNQSRDTEKSVPIQVTKPLAHSDSKRNSLPTDSDPLAELYQKYGFSRRKALLTWIKERTLTYGIDISNFSTSLNDGMGLCALLHSYLPNEIPYDTLKSDNRERNFTLAFAAAQTIGVTTKLDIEEMLIGRPPWQQVMNYLSEIYNRLAVLGKTL